MPGAVGRGSSTVQNMHPKPVTEDSVPADVETAGQPTGWLLRLIIASLLLIPALTLVLALRLHRDIPRLDELGLLLTTRLQEGLTLAKLFHFHNEHQIVITKLVIYLDLVLLNGSRLLPLVASVLCGLGIPLIYGWVSWRYPSGLSRNQILVLTALVGTLYFNGRQLLGLTFPILLVHFSANFLVLLAFAAVAAGGLRSRSADLAPALSPRLLAAFVVAYILAAMSSAGGLLIGPAVLAVIVFVIVISDRDASRLARQSAQIVVPAMVVITAVYVGGYFATTGRQIEEIDRNLWSNLHFVMLFVGAPLWRDSPWPIEHHANPAALYLTCLAFWALLTALGVALFRRRRELTAFDLFHACVIIFVVLTACMGAPFRAQLSTVEAINKKYASTELLAWASAASLAVRFWPRILFGAAGKAHRCLVLCVSLAVVLLPGDLLEYRVWREWNMQVEEAASAFSSDVYSGVLFQRFYHDPRQAFTILTDLRRLGKYCFRSMPAPQYPLSDRFQLASALGPLPRLEASIRPESEEPGLEGFLLSGAGPTTPCTARFPALLVTDLQNRVVGYGSCAGWSAAAHASASGAPEFKLFAVESSREVVPIGFVNPPVLVVSHVGGRRLPAVPDHTDYLLDVFNEVKTPLIQPPVHIPSAGEIKLVGWAVDRVHGRAATGLGVVIEGQEYPALYGSQRKDVADYFKQPGFEASGFVFKLPASKAGAGRHELRLRIYVGGGQEYLETRAYVFIVE
jgi:hypothetical protein